jgi:hypothetical protein
VTIAVVRVQVPPEVQKAQLMLGFLRFQVLIFFFAVIGSFGNSFYFNGIKCIKSKTSQMKILNFLPKRRKPTTYLEYVNKFMHQVKAFSDEPDPENLLKSALKEIFLLEIKNVIIWFSPFLITFYSCLFFRDNKPFLYFSFFIPGLIVLFLFISS